jgi:hypothetical protein
MRKAVVALGVLVGVGSFIPFYYEIGDGSVSLSIVVRSARAIPITAVSAEAFGNAAEAEEVLADLVPPETREHSARSEPFDGKPLVVQIPASYHIRRALLWTYQGSHQYRKLVVSVEFPGTQKGEEGASK